VLTGADVAGSAGFQHRLDCSDKSEAVAMSASPRLGSFELDCVLEGHLFIVPCEVQQSVWRSQ
jgi:hypothetical protein